MSRILVIARNTFRESVRDRVLYVLLFFAFLLMAASQGLGWVSVGEQAAVVQHFSLAAVSFFGALIAVFVGTQLITKEVEKRTIYTVLSKPVRRWEFVVGKYLGLLAVMACMTGGMGVRACGFVLHAGGEVGTVYLWALGLIFLEIAVVTAFALLFSALASPILAAIFTFCAYLVGQVTPSLLALARFEPPGESVAEVTGEHLTDFVAETHWLLEPLGLFLYHALPNLTYFHLRNRVVYGPPLRDGEVANALLYALGYGGAILLLAVLAFDRKRL
jgi:ABC-type transport system involved in multi-copper enzyme maturation permease subunit